MRTSLVFFALSALLIFASVSQAQCIAEVWDSGCDWGHDCVSTDHCTSTNFEVPKTGDYCVKVAVQCDQGDDCKYCQVCANIYKGPDYVAGSNSHWTTCGQSSNCNDDICAHSGQVTLYTNVTYTLYACLSSCGPSCAACPESCQAWAGVYDPESPGGQNCAP